MGVAKDNKDAWMGIRSHTVPLLAVGALKTPRSSGTASDTGLFDWTCQ